MHVLDRIYTLTVMVFDVFGQYIPRFRFDNFGRIILSLYRWLYSTMVNDAF